MSGRFRAGRCRLRRGATARAFARSGAAVALADVNESAVNTAAKQLTDESHQVLALTCDVTEEDHVATAVDRTVETFGRLDTAYSNAGIQIPPADAADEPAEQVDRANAVNRARAHRPRRQAAVHHPPRPVASAPYT
ncbi:SDR family oxidoreductase [Streptomyces pinistramenti]|uniref:SDR family oxidoreductase n=1 Tax=Streptomyces pinistramenti TaxID=2884812 RepID=UPI001D05DC99|nr:SDR family oxidoreductase [Streptomyces pinistramenti]MCB5907757.1 SDR family oxidoreductase [Streptomyces pinistramenti]